MTTEIVTTLTVDARGVETGSAAAVKALKAAQTAFDRVLDAHNKASEASQKGATQTIREAETIARAATAWDRLRTSRDQVVAAEVRAHREVERATITADNAVKRGIATREQANAEIAKTVRAMAELVRAAQAAEQADAAGPLKRAFEGVSQAATQAVRESKVAWANLATGVTQAAQQAEREGRAAFTNLGRAVTEAARGAVQQSNQLWANMGRGVTEAARQAQQQSDVIWGNLARGIAAAARQADAQSKAGWDNLARGVTEAARAAERARRDYANLEGMMDQQVQRQNRLAEAQRVVNAAVAAGAVTQAQGARTLAQYGDAGRLTHYQLSNLSFQLNDVIQGFAIGQRPMSILTQQGFQIVQAMGGVGNTLRSIISPIGLAIAGFAALAVVIATVIARASSLEATARQIAGLNAAMGGASGLTTGEVQGVTRGAAALPGFSRTDTEAATTGLLGNRLISGESFARTLQIGRDLALLTRQELPDAVQTLASALTGGEAGLKRLDQQYNIFSAAQIKLIEQFERQGRVQDQVRLGLDAMADRFAGRGTAALSDMRKALDQASKGFDDFVTGIARSPAGQAALAYLKLQAELLERAGRAVNRPAAPARTRDDVERELAELQDSFAQDPGRGRGYYPPRIAALEAEIARLSYVGPEGARAGVEKAYADLARVKQEAQEAEKKLESLIQKFSPAGKAARDLAAEMEVLADALARAVDPDKAAQLEAALRAAGQAAYEMSSSVRDKNNDATQAAVDAAEVAGADRRQRALVEAEQRARESYLRLSPSERAATDLETYIRKQLQIVREQQGAAVRDLMEDIDAAARHSLEIARAYGKGLKEGYLGEAKAAIDEMVRTTAGLEGQEAELLRQRLQQEAGQAIAMLGRQNATQLPNVEAQERMADAEARGAAAIREAAIANQVYIGTYEARVRAELANNPLITAEYEKQKALLEDLARRQSEAQRRVEAIQLNRQYDPRANYAFEVSRIRDLAATGQVSATAFQAAWREAYINMGTASDSWIMGATSGLLEYARQAERVGGAVADIMVRTFATIEDAIARSLLGLKVDVGNILREIGVDIARTFIRQQITGPIAGFFGNLFSGGSPTAGRPSSVFTGGGALGVSGLIGGGGGSNPLGSLTGGGFNPFGMFGQGGSLSSFLQTPLFGNGGVFGASLASGGSSLGGVLGASGGVGGGAMTIGSGLGAIAGIGSGIFQLATGGGSTSSIIGGLGSMIGAGVSLIPGVGQILGPIIAIGSTLLGGLFKSKPQYAAQGFHTYNAASGRYGGRVGYETNMKAPLAPSIGNDALKLIGAFGGSVAPGMAPPEYYLWRGFENGRMDATVTAEGSPTYARLLEKVWASGQIKTTDEAQWAARTELWTDDTVGGEWTPLPINSLTTDTEKLMQQLALLILKAGVRDGAFTGLSETSQKIIRNFPDADTEGLAQALEWGKKTYDVMIRTDEITAAEKAFGDLRDSFKSAILKAEEFRLATDKLVEGQRRALNKYATDFQQTIDDRILGIQDPAELARVKLDREFDLLRKEAAYINEQYALGLIDTLVDINKIEQAYGLERERIVSEQLTSLLDLWKRLTYGDLSNASPVVTLAGARGTYDDVISRARAGSSAALGELPGAAEDLINAQRAYTGNNAAFETLRLSILSDIAPWVAANQNAQAMQVSFAPTTEAAMGDLIVQLAQLNRLLAEQTQKTADLERQISHLIAA